MTAEDQYAFWRRRMAGEVVPIHDGEPQAGFYRLTDQSKASHPVAYWFKDGVVRCRIGTKDVNEQTANERWPWASKNPISHEVYKAVIAGEPWPDQHEAVTRDRANSKADQDDDSFEALRDRIEDLSREAGKLVDAGAAQDQAAVDRAADLANRLAELHKRADAARAAEKKPHDEAAKAVQAKWIPIIVGAEVFKRLKAAVITPFLVAEDRKRKAAEDAARKAAEEATKAGEPIVEQISKPTPKAGGPGRRAVALRTQKQVEIADRAALIAYFADSQQMTEFLQASAEKAVRAGITPAGVKVTEIQVAA